MAVGGESDSVLPSITMAVSEGASDIVAPSRTVVDPGASVWPFGRMTPAVEGANVSVTGVPWMLATKVLGPEVGGGVIGIVLLPSTRAVSDGASEIVSPSMTVADPGANVFPFGRIISAEEGA